MIVACSLALMPHQEPWFVDITQAEGPRVGCGSEDKRFLPEVNGGGLALVDLDGDGHLDLVVVSGHQVEPWAQGEPGPPPETWLGKGDGTFVRAPKSWQPEARQGWGTGIAVGDLDNDGDEDLVIGQIGAPRVLLNDGRRGLVESEGPTGLPTSGWHTSLALLHANEDPWLDLFLVRYLDFDPSLIPAKEAADARWKGHRVLVGPEGLTPQADRLFLGKGDGTFVLAEGGLLDPPAAFGLGVVVLDIDQDGRDDIYVSNDSMPNHLWRQIAPGRFQEQAFALGLSHGGDGREEAGMGIACEDLDGLGRPSLLVTNFSAEPNSLYRPSRRGNGYRERSASHGLAAPSLTRLGWGTSFFDADLDGDLDAFVLNGHVYPEADLAGTDTSYAEVDDLYRRDGERFLVEPLSASPPRVSRAGVAGDLDRDGDEDLVVLPVQGPLQVLENRAPRGGHWLGLSLRLATGAPALGASVALSAGAEQPWRATRRVTTAGGYQAARPAALRIGIPRGCEEDLFLSITWPDGSRQEARVLELDRVLEIRQGPLDGDKER